MALLRVAALLALCAGADAFTADASVDKARPVTKVINMMKDMLTQLEAEAKDDEEVYEEMGCWCSSNEREKTKAIANGEARVKSLGATIEELTGASSRLNTEIANLDTEVAKNEEALESATALRRKQLAEFNVEEKDMLSSITSMKGAISALSKHHEASFLQLSTTDRETETMTAATTVQHLLRTHQDLLSEVVTPHQRQLLTSLLQVRSSQPQSGEIFGILKGMKESFENNLEQSQKEETENNNAYEDLKAAKTSEIAAGRSLSETKTQELAATDEKLALSKQDIEDTQDTLDSDIPFLANVKERCAGMDGEYAERTKTRQLEMEAVNKALSYLTSDDAHDLFSRTFSFVQRAAVSRRSELVTKILLDAGRKLNKPHLSMLALRTRGARMERVQMALENMVKPLEKEQKAEVEKRDFCIAELNKNEADTAAKVREHADTEAKLDDAKMTIEELSKAIKELTTDIANAKTELKRAGEDREKANKEFQVTVADQRATQKLLRGAKRALQKFYGFAQTSAQTSSATQRAGQPAFSKPGKSKGGIVGVIQGVIDDATKLEAKAIRGEEDAQKAYEDFTKDTNDALEVMSKDLANKKEDKAKTVKDKVQKAQELENIGDEKDHLEQALSDLHGDCDYLLKNFEARQAARHEEIHALKESIAITGGAPMAELLQNLP